MTTSERIRYKPLILEQLEGAGWVPLRDMSIAINNKVDGDLEMIYKNISRQANAMWKRGEIRKRKEDQIVFYSLQAEWVEMLEDFFLKEYDPIGRPPGFRCLWTSHFWTIHHDGSLSKTEPDLDYAIDGLSLDQIYQEVCDALHPSRGLYNMLYMSQEMTKQEPAALLYYLYHEVKPPGWRNMASDFLRYARKQYPEFIDPRSCLYEAKNGKWRLDYRVEDIFRITKAVAIHPALQSIIPDHVLQQAFGAAWNVFKMGEKASSLQQKQQVTELKPGEDEPIISDDAVLGGGGDALPFRSDLSDE